jgi:hypothetical protein
VEQLRPCISHTKMDGVGGLVLVLCISLLIPRNASAVSCLKLFQQQLDFLGLSQDLVEICLENSVSGFVSIPFLCAGIQTQQDWIRPLFFTWNVPLHPSLARANGTVAKHLLPHENANSSHLDSHGTVTCRH